MSEYGWNKLKPEQIKKDREELLKHCQEAADRVAKWPEWKRRMSPLSTGNSNINPNPRPPLKNGKRYKL